MTEQSSVINAQTDNNQTHLGENLNQNVEQQVAEEPVAETTNTSPDVVQVEVTEESKPTETSKKPAPAVELNPEVIAKLKEIQKAGSTIVAKVEDKVKGGLKLSYEGIPIFLPASHYSLRPNPTEDELIQSVGDLLEVEILEINDDVPSHKRNIIVSRKRLLEDKFWNEIKEGQIIEGPVTSVTTFGIFIDIGGFEGLVHISRLSRKRVVSTKSFAKTGDKLKAVVIEVDKEKKRIGLSIADLEPSPWDGIAEKYPVNSIQKAVVKRLVDFGAFVELSDGIEGLIRNIDLSWTKRVNNPKDILTVGQTIDVQVMSINADKELLSLSYKHTQPNPWIELEQKINIGDEKIGIVKQVKPEGAVVTIEEEFDGFIPKSRMRNLLQGKKLPFKKGDSIEVIVADFIPAQQSLILEPKGEAQAREEQQKERQSRNNNNRQQRNDDRPTHNQPIEMTSNEVSNFSFSDMLGEETLSKLLRNKD
ncbi:MAG: S1 RNA-binding domain-containing protein [Candidatus Kapaibacteriota bacterium]